MGSQDNIGNTSKITTQYRDGKTEIWSGLKLIATIDVDKKEIVHLPVEVGAEKEDIKWLIDGIKRCSEQQKETA